MIISHKHKFIFIKTRKTAGTSLEIALSKYCGSRDIITPLSEEDEEIRISRHGVRAQNHAKPIAKFNLSKVRHLMKHGMRETFISHSSAMDIKNEVTSEVWENYYKFSFERNPFDLVVSLFKYHVKAGLTGFTNINDFVETSCYRYSNFDLYSINNKVVVDDVFLYEKMEESLTFLSGKLGVDLVEDMKAIRTKNIIAQQPINIAYTKESESLVRKYFAREIEYYYSDSNS
ncbi:sulfotransferase family protein [Gilvimarinus agarilyticus]|nr:sulfotransferase family protein [Gilvimarinus agarilyticus]